jgi:hypothetical protein
MEEFSYKEYSEEENAIYQEVLPRILEDVKEGSSFYKACDNVRVEDKELKAFIVDDALKILIAELHYKQGCPLHDIAVQLEVPEDVINRANREMIQDVSLSASEVFRSENPDARFGTA